MQPRSSSKPWLCAARRARGVRCSADSAIVAAQNARRQAQRAVGGVGSVISLCKFAKALTTAPDPSDFLWSPIFLEYTDDTHSASRLIGGLRRPSPGRLPDLPPSSTALYGGSDCTEKSNAARFRSISMRRSDGPMSPYQRSVRWGPCRLG